MKIIKRILVLVVLSLSIGLTGCGTLDEAVQQAKTVIPGDWQVLHTEQVNNQSAIVFYVQNNDLGAGLFQKETFGWNWLGSDLGTRVTYPAGLTWRYSDLGNKSTHYYFYYGTVTNSEISSIEVKTTWGEEAKAQIIETGDQRLWYAFLSRSQVPSVDADISGYSAKGERIYLFSQPKQGQ